MAAGLGAVGLGILLGLSVREDVSPAQPISPDQNQSEEPAEIDPLGPNAACYVCHIPFVREELSRVHLPEKVTCVKCHGLSAPHANDENIGATPPDITFKRPQVDKSCAECHEDHDVPARDVVARWLERKRPETPICTDCHGTHKIERPEEENMPGADPAKTSDQQPQAKPGKL